MSEPMEASKAYTDGIKIGASVLRKDQRRRDLLADAKGKQNRRVDDTINQGQLLPGVPGAKDETVRGVY